MMTAIARLFRPIALTLVVTVTTTSFAHAAKHVATPMDAATLHQKLTARGIGKSVRVTNVDGTETKGTLVSIGEDSFQVTPKTPHSQSVFLTRKSLNSPMGTCPKAQRSASASVLPSASS